MGSLLSATPRIRGVESFAQAARTVAKLSGTDVMARGGATVPLPPGLPPPRANVPVPLVKRDPVGATVCGGAAFFELSGLVPPLRKSVPLLLKVDPVGMAVSRGASAFELPEFPVALIV